MNMRLSIPENTASLSAVETAFANIQSPISEIAIGGVAASMTKGLGIENHLTKWNEIEQRAMGKLNSPLHLIITLSE
ncbi:hypothetical protein [Psychrobacillus vulpis]|uniref:Uncharacterized protein n=1 Tax=Psychrobacillus vulpis TaxID=2325572 RepID=A0A544TWM4_9BACI|nr:hypothetical protein [Psychrobacillus vulpis]TQR21831.1 hypothetical protein FG384_02495 [Psychrobacillus vulpis]